MPKLRSECDLLVCLSHIGLARDRELASRRPEIDLIIGGHTHALLETGEQVGRTTIVQAGWWGKHMGIVTAAPGERCPIVSARVESL